MMPRFTDEEADTLVDRDGRSWGLSKKPKSEWSFKQARLRFSEVFSLARTKGPQSIVCNNEAVVVVAAEEFERWTRNGGKTLVEFFAESPLAGSGIDLERAPDFGRNAEEFEN